MANNEIYKQVYVLTRDIDRLVNKLLDGDTIDQYEIEELNETISVLKEERDDLFFSISGSLTLEQVYNKAKKLFPELKTLYKGDVNFGAGDDDEE